MKSLIRHVLAILLFCSFGAFAQAQLPPVDQAASHPDFFTFRARLMTAVANHDADTVLSALNKDVKLSFGGDTGIDDFKEMWRPTAPDTELWQTLAAVLALGGTFESDGTFTAPYVFARWPSDKDPFTHVAIVGKGVRVRSSPSTGGKVMRTLDFAVVELAATQPSNAQWTEVKLSSGHTGFVDSGFVRSPIDYRASFSKINGQWQMTFFIAGD